MGDRIDRYIADVIGRGDEGSALLNQLTNPTLRNYEFVDVLEDGMNGLAVLRVPKDHLVAVHSLGGDPALLDSSDHASSMIDNLVKSAKKEGFTPIAFSNVIDARDGKTEEVRKIGEALRGKADEESLAILNGELAILGKRVNCAANIMGTMISLAPRSGDTKEGIFLRKTGIPFAVFHPRSKPLYINSDGIGTKTEFYERAGKFTTAWNDFAAMNLDDTVKLGATAQVLSGVVETRKGRKDKGIPFNLINHHAKFTGNMMGLYSILHCSDVGERIRGYNDDWSTLNLSGSVVSTIDEERLRNPLRPSAGESLIAIRGNPNPRSNGITDKRKMMVHLFGERWHETPEGKLFLEFLAEPSTILYPVFTELIQRNLATSVYHMSGGAFKGKLARPIAKHGLYVNMKDLFLPDYRELALAGAGFTSAEVAYSKWPMGNDGFVTTKDPERTIRDIRKMGLEARVVGQLEMTDKTGVRLEVPTTGEFVEYSGRE